MNDEKWKIGKINSCVVSDTKVSNTNFPNITNGSDDEKHAVDYYSGHLVCESIGNYNHALVISKAPEMIDACRAAMAIFKACGISENDTIVKEQYKKVKDVIDCIDHNCIHEWVRPIINCVDYFCSKCKKPSPHNK
jgi:hypothetical protein